MCSYVSATDLEREAIQSVLGRMEEPADLSCLYTVHCTVVQSRKNHGSVVALLSGKFLQIRKVFVTRHLFAQNCPRKPSGWLGNCPDNLETVRTI